MNKNKELINDQNSYFDTSNEISINDLIWELDNSKDFELFEIENESISQSKDILIRIYQK